MRGAGTSGTDHRGGHQLDVDHAVGEGTVARDPAAEHPGHHAAGQVDRDRAGVLPGQRLGGVADQGGLVTGVEHPAGVVVEHDHVVAQGQHDAAGPAAGAHVLLQQMQVAAAARGQQGLGDLVGGRLHERDQQRIRVLAPAGQVDDADRLARDRVVDRHPGAGQALQVLGVVLVPEDVGGPAGLQRGADAVGAHLVLGVAEAGGQLDVVQVPLEVVIGGQPGQHQAGRVGQDDADRLAVKLLVQVPQHRVGRPGQVGFQVGVAQVVELDVVGGDVPLPGPPPGRQDGLADSAGINRLGGEKPLPGFRQQVSRRVQRHRCTRHIASPTPHITAGGSALRGLDPGLPAHYKVNLRLPGTVSS